MKPTLVLTFFLAACTQSPASDRSGDGSKEDDVPPAPGLAADVAALPDGTLVMSLVDNEGEPQDTTILQRYSPGDEQWTQVPTGVRLGRLIALNNDEVISGEGSLLYRINVHTGEASPIAVPESTPTIVGAAVLSDGTVLLLPDAGSQLLKIAGNEASAVGQDTNGLRAVSAMPDGSYVYATVDQLTRVASDGSESTIPFTEVDDELYHFAAALLPIDETHAAVVFETTSSDTEAVTWSTAVADFGTEELGSASPISVPGSESFFMDFEPLGALGWTGVGYSRDRDAKGFSVRVDAEGDPTLIEQADPWTEGIAITTLPNGQIVRAYADLPSSDPAEWLTVMEISQP